MNTHLETFKYALDLMGLLYRETDEVYHGRKLKGIEFSDGETATVFMFDPGPDGEFDSHHHYEEHAA